MKKTALWSVVIACMIGCTGTGGPEGEALSGVDPDGEGPRGGQGCAQVCSPYDPSQCETVCPPEPPDAAIPDDPYQGDEPPQGSPVDGGSPQSAPEDPYALGGETHRTGAGHRSC